MKINFTQQATRDFHKFLCQKYPRAENVEILMASIGVHVADIRWTQDMTTTWQFLLGDMDNRMLVEDLIAKVGYVP
jgi:hypothetical protein